MSEPIVFKENLESGEDDDELLLSESNHQSQSFFSKLPFFNNNKRYRNLDDNIENSKAKQKKIYFWLFAGICLLFFLSVIVVASSSSDEKEIENENKNPTKNLIFMLSDGMGPASLTLTRVVSQKSRLNLDDYLVGTVRSYSTSSWVTDSAAGATAYACAQKTYNGAISVNDDEKPIGTLLEAAQTRGMPSGLVVTSRITHATPAAFSSHSVHRDYEEFIALQQSESDVDVILGGGRRFFNKRLDGRDLLEEMKSKGYLIFTNASEFRNFAKKDDETLKNNKIIGLFNDDHMTFMVDRDDSLEPTLLEMSQLALKMLKLKSNEKGFFCLIEGSRIDMAAHNNDPVAHVGELLAYDEAFGYATSFAKENKNTFIVSSSDHETGGLSLGLRYDSFFQYPLYEWNATLIRSVHVSAYETARLAMLPNANIVDLVTKYGFVPDDTELFVYEHLIEQKAQKQLMLEISNGLSRRAHIGWSTIGHSGVDVNLYTVGDPSLSSETLKKHNLQFLRDNKLGGNIENIDVGKYMALSLNLFDELSSETTALEHSSLDVHANGMNRNLTHTMRKKRSTHETDMN